MGNGTAAQVLSLAVSSLQGATQGAQPRGAAQGARRGDRPLVRHPRRQGDFGARAARRCRRDARVQERRARRRSADAADQLARSDQCAEGFQAHRRRPGGSHQLVRPDHHDESERGLEDRHAPRRRHHALLQYDQWRTGLRLRQGRQDRPHDADRLRRRRSAPVDHRGARAKAYAAAQDHSCSSWPKCEVDRLFARSPALSDEARRLRSEWRAQPTEPRQVRLRADLLAGGARSCRRRDQAAQVHVWPGCHGRLARFASYLGQHRLLSVGAIPFPQRGRLHADPS